jgi:hypothetical protein
MTIINDDSRVANKLEASLTDDARVIIYDYHMFKVQATSCGVTYGRHSDNSRGIINERNLFIVQATEASTIKTYF